MKWINKLKAKRYSKRVGFNVSTETYLKIKESQVMKYNDDLLHIKYAFITRSPIHNVYVADWMPLPEPPKED